MFVRHGLGDLGFWRHFLLRGVPEGGSVPTALLGLVAARVTGMTHAAIGRPAMTHPAIADPIWAGVFEHNRKDRLMTPPIPVIVLNWNGVDDTCRCLQHLLASEGVAVRAIVIDNGSDQPSEFETLKARFGDDPRVELRANRLNLGFARGMNQALQALMDERERASNDAPSSQLDYVALLNNDAFVEPQWLAALVHRAKISGAGAVASCMLRDDEPSVLDNAGHVFLNTGEVLPRGSRAPADAYSKSAEVRGVCAGACLLKLDMLKAIGLFDPFYGTGYEDAELGLRAMLAGWRQVYEPKAKVRHKIGASIDQIRDLDYAVGLQTNIHYAYFKLMPKTVMLANGPWLVLKTLALLFVPPMMGRWRLAKVHWLAAWRSLKLVPAFVKARKSRPQQVMSSRQILSHQTFFFGRYWHYFNRYVRRGERTIFER